MLGKTMSDERRRQPQETRAHEDAGRVNAVCQDPTRFSEDEIRITSSQCDLNCAV